MMMMSSAINAENGFTFHAVQTTTSEKTKRSGSAGSKIT